MISSASPKVPDPHLGISGGGGGRGGSSRPLGQKFFSAQFGLKIMGAPGPLDPLLTKTLFIILMVRNTRCPKRDTFETPGCLFRVVSCKFWYQ